jgi:3-carboxy-cis,cis-muconate cycloisomerase
MTDLLRVRPATTRAMLALFDDTALAHALAIEAELARAQAAKGVIDCDVAETVAHACEQCTVSPGELAKEAALAGTLAIPLKRLRSTLDGPPPGCTGARPAKASPTR